MYKLAEVDFGAQFLGTGNTSYLGNAFGVGQLVSLFVKGAFAFAGLLLLFYFIMGGIGMIAGAGADDPKKIEQGKATATSAMIGFAVVFGSYWIVKLIGQLLGIDNLV